MAKYECQIELKGIYVKRRDREEFEESARRSLDHRHEGLLMVSKLLVGKDAVRREYDLTSAPLLMRTVGQPDLIWRPNDELDVYWNVEPVYEDEIGRLPPGTDAAELWVDATYESYPHSQPRRPGHAWYRSWRWTSAIDQMEYALRHARDLTQGNTRIDTAQQQRLNADLNRLYLAFDELQQTLRRTYQSNYCQCQNGSCENCRRAQWDLSRLLSDIY